jgi:chromosome segregation ATPase
MPDEIRIPINAKIPQSLHDSLVVAVEAEKYKDKTACITEALEKLLCNTQEEALGNTSVLLEKDNEIQNLNSVLQRKYAEISEIQNVLQNKDSEILRLQRVIQEAPDRAEFARLQAKYEEIKEHNDTLKAELNKAERDKEDLKVTYANYFTQVQTLINQKAIEAPGAKRPWWRFW